MKVVVEFHLTDMSMYKHIKLFELMMEKWSTHSIQDMIFLEPDQYKDYSMLQHMIENEKYRNRK